MGITVHIGPYYKCKITKIQNTVEVDACGNKDCDRHGRPVSQEIKYCPDCGTKIGLVEVPNESDSVDYGEVCEACDDFAIPLYGDTLSFWMDENLTHLWLHCGAEDESCSFDPKEECAIEDFKDIPHAKAKARKHIERLETHYGKGNVELCWGVISEHN